MPQKDEARPTVTLADEVSVGSSKDDSVAPASPKKGRSVRYVILGLVFALLIMLASPFIYLHRVGGLKGVIETQLAQRLAPADVRVGDVGFEVRIPSLLFTIVAEDVEVVRGDTELNLPQASAMFSPASLMMFRPLDVVLSGLDLDVTLGGDGWSGSPAAQLLAGLAVQTGGAEGPVADGPRRLLVELATITVRKADTELPPLHFSDVDFEIIAGQGMPLSGGVQAVRMIEDKPAGTVAATILGNVADRTMSFDVRTNQLNATGLSEFLPGLPPLFSGVGQISGQVSLDLSGQDIQFANADLVAIDGMIDASPMLLPLRFDTASLGIAFDRNAGTLAITQTELVLSDGRILQFSGEFAELNSLRPSISAKLRGNRLPLDQVFADWPKGLASDVKSAAQERFAGGQLEDLTLEFTGGFDRATSHLDVVSLDLRSSLVGVGVDLKGGQYERFTGTGDGNITLRLGAGAIVEELGVALGVSGGSLRLKDALSPLALNRFQMTAALEDDALAIEEVSLSLADGGTVGVSGRIELGNGWKINEADLSMVANAIDVKKFHAIWPEWLVSRTRNWVGAKVHEAQVEDVRLRFLTSFGGDKPKLTDMEGSITLRDVRLELGQKIPVFTDIDGRMQIADNRAEMILTDGEVERLELRNGRVVIEPVIGGGAMAATDMEFEGDVADALAVGMTLGFAGGDNNFQPDLVATGQSELAVKTSFPIRRKLKPNDIDFQVAGQVTNGDIGGLPFGADARNANLQVDVRRDAFEIAGNARIFDLPSDVKYSWSREGETSEANISLGTQGELQNIANIASRFGIDSFAGVDLASVKMDGTADVSLRMMLPTGQPQTPSDLNIETDLLIHNASFENLPIIGRAEKAELVASFTRDVSEVSGVATAFGVAVDFAVTADREEDRLTLRANAPRSEGVADFASQMSGLDVSGSIGGAVNVITSLDRQNFEIDLDVDLNETGISVPSLGWAKLPAEDGRAQMHLQIADGRLVSIRDLSVEAGSLVADGMLLFSQSAGNGPALAEASFKTLTWPGNDIRLLELKRSETQTWLVNAEARQIDIAPLRRNQGPGEGQPVDFDILADQIVVGDGLVLSGHISGARELAGNGKAEFSGALFFNDRPLFAESQVRINFGPDGESLHGTGIIGGAEASLTYRAANGAKPELTMVSQNGGRTLAGLGITDAIRSGEMLLKTQFVDGYENFDTNIRITNFRVVDTPTAVRAFSVLAPTGLLGLVEGEGTAFNWGEALLQKRGPKINMYQVTGQGQAVSVAFVGQYDQETKQVDVSGNLVPASFLSRVIGVIPLVGEILTGIDNAGLFVTQFSLKGDIEDPESSVTPASIVPGVLRDLFSPDWLRREGDRILGPTANGYANGS